MLGNGMPFDERLIEAGKMLVVGLGTVFAALAVLWLALTLFRLALSIRFEKKKKAPVIVLEDTPPLEAVKPVIESNDDAIVAAITAAVAATLAEENGGVVPSFRVVSFRRANQK